MRASLALLLAFGIAACTESGPKLVIGTEPEFPPFESKNADGEFVGLDMDMARDLAAELGLELEIRAMAFESLVPALKSRDIDLIVSGMTRNEERAKSVAFTEPYFVTGLCLLVNKDSGIEKPADVNGKRVVVKQGTTGESNAVDFYPQSEIIRLPTEGQCALDVVSGRADAFLYDKFSILRHHRQSPKTTRVIPELLTTERYAMAARLGEDEFVAKVNAFLEKWRADGRRAKLLAKYDLEDGAK
jgi:polar amino acid transport system substrate-binding protein